MNREKSDFFFRKSTKCKNLTKILLIGKHGKLKRTLNPVLLVQKKILHVKHLCCDFSVDVICERRKTVTVIYEGEKIV